MIRIPKAYLHLAGYGSKRDDAALGFDEYARAAMETYRSSYSPLPTCGVREFGAFFSKGNFEWLKRVVAAKAGYEPDSDELYETMMRAYQSVQPRSDRMDDRREVFTREVTRSYVDELNGHVIEWAVEDTAAANQLWEHLAKYRHGPRDMGMDDSLGGGVDTRTRYVGASYDGTWLMPK